MLIVNELNHVSLDWLVRLMFELGICLDVNDMQCKELGLCYVMLMFDV